MTDELKNFRVTMNARKRGAIGIFYPVAFDVVAPCGALALNAAVALCDEGEWEYNHCHSITEFEPALAGG